MTTPRDEKLFDVRTLERRLRRGIISRKDYDKYVKALPDVSDKVDRRTEVPTQDDA